MSKDFTENAAQQMGVEIEMRRLQQVLDQKVLEMESLYETGTQAEIEGLMAEIMALRDEIGMLNPAISTIDKNDILVEMAKEMNRKLYNK